MNTRLVEQHCQVKMGDKIIDKRLAQIQRKQERQEQKVMDELSMNRFFSTVADQAQLLIDQLPGL